MSLEDRIFKVLDETGCGYATAAVECGITYETLKVRQRESEDFSSRLSRARAKFETMTLRALADQIKGGNVRAMTFWLERARPQNWGRKIAVTGVDGKDLPFVQPAAAADVHVTVNIAQQIAGDPEGRADVAAIVDRIRQRYNGGGSEAVAGAPGVLRQPALVGKSAGAGAPPQRDRPGAAPNGRRRT